jgi:hypothetical protein
MTRYRFLALVLLVGCGAKGGSKEIGEGGAGGDVVSTGGTPGSGGSGSGGSSTGGARMDAAVETHDSGGSLPPDTAVSGPPDARADTLASADARSDLAAPPPADAAGGAGGTGPIGMVGKTACLNADGPGGLDTYPLIDKVLGANAVEHNPDMDHTPAFQHVKEDSDAEVGNHFVFYAHYPEDNDGAPGDDRSRIEIKVNGGAAPALKGLPGDTMTYTWRFKMNADMKFSNRFTHMHQIKSYGGNDGAPIITITGSGSGASENLRVDHWGDGTDTTTLARVPTAGLKGIWLAVRETITVGDSGSIQMTIKKPDGTTVVNINQAGLDFWRQGEYVRGKWGIYRGKSDQLKAGEELVRFANFGITKGGAPSSTCGAP